MNLYILRHGETDWNKAMRMQGQVDIPLNEYGIQLAEKTRDGLKDINFDYVFTSPLNRAVTTAKIVTGLGEEKLIKDDRIKEISFGEYEGKYPDERPPEFMDFFKAPDKYVPAAKAESYEMLCARTRDFIESVILPLADEEGRLQQTEAVNGHNTTAANCDINVLISGHGAMNKSLLLYFKKLEIKDIWSGPFQKNCSVSLVKIKNSREWEFVFENKVFYEEQEYKPLWLVKSILDDDYGCEERTKEEATYIVKVESEKGEKKELVLTESFLDKHSILEGRYINEDILFN